MSAREAAAKAKAELAARKAAFEAKVKAESTAFFVFLKAAELAAARG